MPYETVEIPRPTEVDDHEVMRAVDRMAVFGYLGQMVNVGIPLARALDSIAEQYPDGHTRAVLSRLGLELRHGAALSTAMRRFPGSFSALHVGVIAAGETSGRLAPCLQRLARHEERWFSLTRQVRAMMVYPLFVFGAALVLITGLAQVLVSGVAPIVADAKIKMNPLSRLVFWVAGGLRNPAAWALVLAGGIVLGVALARWRRSPGGQRALERLVLRLPLVGEITRKIEAARVCESLATLHESGVAISRALIMTANACETEACRQALLDVESRVVNGMTLSEAFERSGFFHISVAHMVAVGETSGKLTSMLIRSAGYHDLEVRTALEQFAAALEPMMISGLGVLVAVIILLAFAPLYQLVSGLS
ncbi:MAG: type II secretion system F family protein [Proteobacteria bacterium]|nr:type II secretion system F family protein [Pseudomonadota bacterium]